MTVHDQYTDLDALLCGNEPDYSTDPTPEPAADVAKATALLRTLGARKRELEGWEDLYTAQRAQLDEWIDGHRTRLGARVSWLEAWLANWHRAQLGEHGSGPKTFTLPSGVLTARAQQPEWTFDPGQFVPWAEANAPGLLRRKPAPAPEIDKAAAKKALTVFVDDGTTWLIADGGEVVPGVTVNERPPKFTATPER